MNQYLFLFPVKEYFKACLDSCRTFEIEGHKPSKLVNIINVRYRDREYGINWLLFSRKDDLSKPDLSQVPDFIKIQKTDGILVAGVSFKKHISEEVYTAPNYVLNQLSSHKMLVLGGFHQWDCVDKIARRSHERGIKTFVDEDTTELFFGRQAFQGIPLIRENWSLRELGIDEKMYDFVRAQRKNSPWFVQV